MPAAFLCTILFSASVICGHRASNRIGPTEANFWRATAAGLFLGIWALYRGDALGGMALGWFVASGALGIGVGDTAFFQALRQLGPTVTMLLVNCLQPTAGVLIEWLWLGTRLTPRQIFCGIVILAGVAIALAPHEKRRIPRRNLIIGTLFCAVAAVTTAYAAVMSRKGYAISHIYDPMQDAGTVTFQRVLGGIIPAGIVLIWAKQRQWQIQRRASGKVIAQVSSRKWRETWRWVALNALFGQTLGVACMQKALATTPTGIVLAIISVTPIVVVPFAWLFEGEKPTVRSLLGGIVAVSGAVGLIL